MHCLKAFIFASFNGHEMESRRRPSGTIGPEEPMIDCESSQSMVWLHWGYWISLFLRASLEGNSAHAKPLLLVPNWTENMSEDTLPIHGTVVYFVLIMH